jgi:hypothetical protein
VHRLSRSSHGGNLLYTTNLTEIKQAVEQFGYTDQGVVFYAAKAKAKAGCLIPVWSYYKDGVHRFVTGAADKAMLAAAGWRRDAVRFYVGRPVVDPTFTFAVYPDTQQEVLRKSDRRFIARSQWLVRQRKAQDLRFVTHTGDVVNWDTADHAQYVVARDGLAPLEQAGIPYSLSIGNHDTAAVCAGGGACDSQRTRKLVRDTRTFNRYLNRQSLNQEGAYEAGRVDNTYHVYTAGGISWLVLNLELWQRPGVLSWAQRVVKAHPKHNVIVVTHSYLTAKGRISTKAEYGDTAPSVLARKLVKRYPNVRMVFSGHVGQAAHRVDKGAHGNRIDSFVVAMHSNTTNPTQLVRVDTEKNTLKSWMYAPRTNTRYPKDTVRVNRIRWVR